MKHHTLLACTKSKGTDSDLWLKAVSCTVGLHPPFDLFSPDVHASIDPMKLDHCTCGRRLLAARQ